MKKNILVIAAGVVVVGLAAGQASSEDFEKQAAQGIEANSGDARKIGPASSGSSDYSERMRRDVFKIRMLARLRALHWNLTPVILPLAPTVRYPQSGWDCVNDYQGPGGKRYCYGVEQTATPVLAYKKTDALKHQTDIALVVKESRIVMGEFVKFLETEKTFPGYTERELGQLNSFLIRADAVSRGGKGAENSILDAVERSNDQLRHANSEYVQISGSFLNELDTALRQSLRGKADVIAEMLKEVRQAAAHAKAGPVRFLIVAKNEEDRAAIFKAAAPLANLNPYGRELSLLDEDGSDEQKIETWAAAAEVKHPGAVVLSGDGSLSDVLSVEDAKNAGMIESAFLDAFGY